MGVKPLAAIVLALVVSLPSACTTCRQERAVPGEPCAPLGVWGPTGSGPNGAWGPTPQRMAPAEEPEEMVTEIPGAPGCGVGLPVAALPSAQPPQGAEVQ